MFPRSLLLLCSVLLLCGPGCDDRIVDIIEQDDTGGDADSDSDGDTDSDSDSDSDGDKQLNAVVVTVEVPEQFHLEPKYDDWDIRLIYLENEDPPQDWAGLGAFYIRPYIGSDHPYDLVSAQVGLSGKYFVEVHLWVHPSNAPHMLWIGTSQDPVKLGEGTGVVNVGKVMLQPEGDADTPYY